MTIMYALDSHKLYLTIPISTGNRIETRKGEFHLQEFFSRVSEPAIEEQPAIEDKSVYRG